MVLRINILRYNKVVFIQRSPSLREKAKLICLVLVPTNDTDHLPNVSFKTCLTNHMGPHTTSCYLLITVSGDNSLRGHTHTNARAHTLAHPPTHTCTLSCANAHTHIHTHTQMHILKHASTNTHTHTYTTYPHFYSKKNHTNTQLPVQLCLSASSTNPLLHSQW